MFFSFFKKMTFLQRFRFILNIFIMAKVNKHIHTYVNAGKINLKYEFKYYTCCITHRGWRNDIIFIKNSSLYMVKLLVSFTPNIGCKMKFHGLNYTRCLLGQIQQLIDCISKDNSNFTKDTRLLNNLWNLIT